MSTVNELVDALLAPASADVLRALDEEGTLTRFIPELEDGRGFVQPERHYYDVLDHNLAAVAAADAVLGRGGDAREIREALAWVDIDELLGRQIEGLPMPALIRLGCLVHDVAKPATAVRDEGRLRFP